MGNKTNRFLLPSVYTILEEDNITTIVVRAEIIIDNTIRFENGSKISNENR